MLFKVNHVIPYGSSGEAHTPGEVKPAHKLAGLDLAWLVQCGALSPIGVPGSTALLGDDPSQDQLLAEIGRLQSKLERVDALNTVLVNERDAAVRAAEEVRAMAPVAGSEVLAGLGIKVEADVDPLQAVARELAGEREVRKAAEADRDAARHRADQYAERLTQLERNVSAAHPDPSHPGPHPTGDVVPEKPPAPPVMAEKPDPKRGRR